MAFSKYFPLVAATTVILLVVTLVGQSDALAIAEEKSTEKLDIISDISEDGNIVIAMGDDAIKKIHEHSKAYLHLPEHVGEAIAIFRVGWEKTLKLISQALAKAFELIDKQVGRDIQDKQAAFNTINNGMNDVRSLVYRSGIPVHSCLGAGKSIAHIAEKGEFKHAIDLIQETATILFDNLDSAQIFAIQGMKAHGTEVRKMCLQAAHAAITSAAETANTNFVVGANNTFDYFANSDASTLTQPDPTEEITSNKAKEAAAADSDTVAAMEGLNKEFDNIIKVLGDKSISTLNEIKEGLVDYINHLAWAIATCYHALVEAQELAKTDQEAATRVIDDAIKIAKSILIDGSVKAYEALGAAGRASGSMDQFQDAIEITERSRVEGTKGFELAMIVAKSGIKTGGPAAEHACDASHKMLQANEAVIFDFIHELRHIVFNAIKPDGKPMHAEH